MRILQSPMILILALAVAAVSLAPTAAAHASATSTDGKIKVTWGWTTEPALSDTPNGLDLVLRYAENNSGVVGVPADALTVTLMYGEESLTLESIQPQRGREAEGRYTGPEPITPSASGLYVLKVAGTVEGSEIDLEIPATHEVPSMSSTYFPPMQTSDSDTSALEDRIADLESKVAALEAKATTQSNTPATTTTVASPTPESNGAPGLGVGMLLGALAATAIALASRRRA